METLIAGRAVPGERLDLAWQIIVKWLAALSLTRKEVTLDPQQLVDLDFDLSLAGLSSQFSVSGLLNQSLGIPYLNTDRFQAGYRKHNQALDNRHALTVVIDDIDGRSQPFAQQLLCFLNDFEQKSLNIAEDAHQPDLVALLAN